MNKRISLALAAALLLSVYHHASFGAGSSDATIDIKTFAFVPQDITVLPGTTVTWANKDETAHSVVANTGAFASAGLDTDDRYSFTFKSEGDFAYFCSLHPHMIGTVHVRAP